VVSCLHHFQGRLDVRALVTHLTSQSPGQKQALAPRIFHLNRHAIAARIFYLKHHAIEQTPAPRVLHLNRHDFAPGVFHFNHHVIGQALAPDRFFSELRSG
jgi:hypothetical protein